MVSPTAEGRTWVALLLLAGVVALWLSFRWQEAPIVGNDSYQYMDTASHIAAGKCICGEIAHFDEQVAAGRMPVPFTHFPPGYPLLIAALSFTGARMDVAGYLISAAGFLLTIWLIWELARILGAKPIVTALLCLLWIVHAAALFFASNVGADSIFTAALVGTGVLMARDIRADGRRPLLLLGLGATVGAAYWLRYAGLFILPVAALYIVWRAWRSPRVRIYAGAALLLEATFVVTLVVRNIIYVGSWKGGFTTGSGHGLRSVLGWMAKAVYHLIFGDRAVARVDFWTALFIVSLLVASSAWRRANWGAKDFPAVTVWMGILTAAYLAGIVATALTSIASDLVRYIAPVYPILLAGLAALFSVPGTRLQVIAVTTLVLSVLAVQSRSLKVRPALPSHVVATKDLQQDVALGVSIEQWLLDHVPPSSTIVSVNGQAVHYLLNRPVVSIIEPEFSTHRLDGAALHALMKQFSARYLVVFPGETAFAVSTQDSIPFLRSLISGGVPDWLKPAVSTRNTEVFECGDCQP